jgi:hypothetical protein
MVAFQRAERSRRSYVELAADLAGALEQIWLSFCNSRWLHRSGWPLKGNSRVLACVKFEAEWECWLQ